MIKEIYQEVKSLLEQNKEYTNNQIFLLMAQKDGFKDGSAICNAMWKDDLSFSFESVTRTIRKVREESPSLRDSKYSKRKNHSEPKVREEIKQITEYSDFHTQKVKQGNLL